MKKEKKIISILFLITLLMNCNVVYAHPGRTNSSGCHYCKTNCSSWGLDDGEYHCHNGNTYTNSKGQVFSSDGSLINDNASSNSNSSNSSVNDSSNNSNSSTSSNNNSSNSNNNSSSSNITNNASTTYVKSKVATISSLKIDGNNVTISNEMNFTTTNYTPTIVATPTSKKASVKINKSEKLEYGNNEIAITVTAEDSTTKQYKLNIIVVSNDATLNNIKVNGKNIEISDEMNFSTTESEATIEAISNNENARISYDEKYKLNIGDNRIVIKVEAEDGKTNKEYILNIKRELVLSDDTGITVFINEEKVNFNNYKSDVVYISSDISEINIKYELSDENAKIDLDYEKNIEVGDKTIKFKVIAESGKEQEYTINIHRYSKTEDIIYTILAFALIGGIGFGIYKLFKKIKTISKR